MGIPPCQHLDLFSNPALFCWSPSGVTLLTPQPALKLAFSTPSCFWFLSYFGLLPSGTPSIRLLPLFNDPLLRPLGKPASLRAPVSKVLWPLWPPWGCRMMDDGLQTRLGFTAWPGHDSFFSGWTMKRAQFVSTTACLPRPKS